MKDDWDFRETFFLQMWNTLTQWRYVRIAAFAWIILGYSRGWELAAEPFRGLVVAITAILALASLIDVILLLLPTKAKAWLKKRRDDQEAWDRLGAMEATR